MKILLCIAAGMVVTAITALTALVGHSRRQAEEFDFFEQKMTKNG